MSGIILGVPGVGFRIGARVRFVTGDRGIAFTVTSVAHDGSSVAINNAWYVPDVLALDLTFGPLDNGTRALLHLARPSEPEPLTAPAWVPAHRNKSVWRLEWFRHSDHLRMDASFEVEGDDPRQALADAMASLVSARASSPA